MAIQSAHRLVSPHDALAPSAVPAKHSPLSVRGLTVAYHQKPVLWDVHYTAPDGGLVAVIGPNGAGKTTLIKAMLGLVPVLSGQITVFGQPARQKRRRIGYVPQRNSVDWDFPATALDVVTMGLYGRIGWLRPVRRRHREEARRHLDLVGMADFADRQIGQLSGGQQQRVFLARALAQEARLYLMDEPFAGVDAATESAIANMLKALREDGRTILCVHHDLQTVPDYFEHVLILNTRVVAHGPVQQAFTQQNLHVAYGGRLAASAFEAVAQRA